MPSYTSLCKDHELRFYINSDVYMSRMTIQTHSQLYSLLTPLQTYKTANFSSLVPSKTNEKLAVSDTDAL